MTANLNLSFNPVDYSLSYQIHGNTVLKDAEVVCVVYQPADRKNQKKNDALVDFLWNEHLVLTEFLPTGSEIVMDGKFKRVKQICGWDISDIETLLDARRNQERILLKIGKLVEDAQSHLKWENQIKKRSAWVNFLSLFRDLIGEECDQLKALLEGRHGLDEFKDKFYPLYARVKRVLCEQLNETYKNTFQSRLSSLEQAIENTMIRKQKVIVCLSPNFVIRDPTVSEECFDNRNFLTFLEKRKYVILNLKNSSYSIDDQPSLWFSQDLVNGLPLKMNNQNGPFLAGSFRPLEGKQAVAHEETTNETRSNKMLQYIWQRSGLIAPVIRFKINGPHHPADFPKLPF